MANEGADANSGNYSYDVFFSFRGKETRPFVKALYGTLREKGLIIYWEDEVVIREEPWPSMCKAIEKSRILIVVFSKNYANSSFCLNELDKIVECQNLNNNQLVFPIFYDVDPSDVTQCKNSYAQAMEKNEFRFGREKVEKWRLGLSKVGSLKGWYFQSDGKLIAEDEFAQEFSNSITKNAVDPINHSFLTYDVFLSFSWKDTRYSFTGFLHNVLKNEGFKIFMDDDERGKDSDNDTHTNVIKESKFSIIVFSENYADSPSCLDTLVKIIECTKSNIKQRVLPVFYKVQPSDVRYQVSHFSEAMTKHESGNDRDKVQKWRSALFEVASLKGWHFQTVYVSPLKICELLKRKFSLVTFGDAGYEYKTIENIVGLVKKSLPRYDVFLSFRGLDTRCTFTGYLYYALCKKGVKTFMDDEVLEGGEKISDTLTNAIKESRASIVVFSENYAYSSWCLDELVHIVNCRRMKKDHLVWPIYYKVEPSDVWNKKKSYHKAMEAHKNRLGSEDKRVEKWKLALSEVESLEKLHFKDNDRFECEFIEEIVKKISEELETKT